MFFSSLSARLKELKLNRAERTLLIVFIIFSVGLTVPPLFNTIKNSRGQKDYATWDEVAHAVRDGKPIYLPGKKVVRDFFYPPAIASLFYAPLSFAGLWGMVLLLCVFSCLGHFVSLCLSVYFATGRLRAPPSLWWVAFATGVPFVVDIYFLGQLNLTLLSVMLLAFLALEKKHPVIAGSLLALAAAAKAFPFSAIGYLVWRRHWTAAASMLGALVLILVVLPAPIRGFDRNWRELSTWTDNMLLHNTGDSLANQEDRAFRYGNQTLMSVVHRLTRHLNVGKKDREEIYVNFTDISSKAAFVIFLVIAGTMCLALVMAMPARNRATPQTNALEYAIVLLMIVIFSPKAGSYYYCWSIPGFTMITAEVLRAPAGSKQRRWLMTGLLLSLMVMALALTQNFDVRLQGMGATMWGAVLLFITLVALLWNKKRAAAADSSVLAAA